MLFIREQDLVGSGVCHVVQGLVALGIGIDEVIINLSLGDFSVVLCVLEDLEELVSLSTRETSVVAVEVTRSQEGVITDRSDVFAGDGVELILEVDDLGCQSGNLGGQRDGDSSRGEAIHLRASIIDELAELFSREELRSIDFDESNILSLVQVVGLLVQFVKFIHHRIVVLFCIGIQ